jgi:hypothetical protein
VSPFLRWNSDGERKDQRDLAADAFVLKKPLGTNLLAVCRLMEN